MAIKTAKKDITLKSFPEEITEEGVKIYGETSYENQMAVLSHSRNKRKKGRTYFGYP